MVECLGRKLRAGIVLGSALALPACLTVMGAPTEVRREPSDTAAVASSLSGMERDVLEAINRERAQRGLQRLAVSEKLTRMARDQSEHQARTGKMGHEGEGGSHVSDRARRARIAYRRIAENVAMNQGHRDPVAVAVTSWMRSAGHRKNILEPAFHQTGVGVVEGRDGEIYFTQVFLDPEVP